jgi:hypothetical protein
MGKKTRSGTGMNIPDHISESLETTFWIKNTSIYFLTLDPGWKKFGSRINIPNPQHWVIQLTIRTLLS